jgi:signal transduction histidine kinase
MVLDGDAGPINPMQEKLLTQSFNSAQRMVYLIADLLNISRLKTGKFIIEPSPTNLAKITKDEVSQLVDTAKGRGLELTYDKPQDFPTYMLDSVKIRQVIMNFVDNAIYYTQNGGHIHVELQDKSKAIELRVIDDGIGVPRGLQHHLFSKFYRAPNAQKARPDGTGLGLFMAKKIVVAQGGSIIFESSEGKGSVFGFSFAKSKIHLAPEKSTTNQSAVVTAMS